MKRIALKGGPRGGTTVDVPDAFTAFTFPGGVYRIKGKTATWEENAGIKGATPTAVIVDEAAAVTTVANTTGVTELVLDDAGLAALNGSTENGAKQSKPKRARK